VAQEVEIGSSFTLVCIAEGFPLPSMQWYFNDAKINNSSSRYIVDDSSMNSVTTTLTVRMVEADDDGAYYCEAISGHYDLATVSSERVNITVNGESNILTAPFYCAHLLRQLNIVHTHTNTHTHWRMQAMSYTTNRYTLIEHSHYSEKQWQWQVFLRLIVHKYAIFTQVVSIQREFLAKKVP